MLELAETTVQAILRWAGEYPNIEVCGLVYRCASGLEVVHPMMNSHSEPDKFYEVSVPDMVNAYKVMDADGGTPIAFYHSHPGGSTEPSETDMQGALNIGMYYLIAYPETAEVSALGKFEPIKEYQMWQLSAWECLEPGILIGADWRVAPLSPLRKLEVGLWTFILLVLVGAYFLGRSMVP